MLSSLPLVAPRDAHKLWYTPSHSYGFTTPPASTAHHFQALSSNQYGIPTSRQHNQSRENRRVPASFGLSALAQLDLDEKSVEARKAQIQRFGSTWIKPPGIAKTLQGELDEKLEREEHMAMEEAATEGMDHFAMERAGMTQNEEFTDGDNLPDGVELTMEGEDDGEAEDGDGEMFEEGLEEEPDLDAEIPEGSAGGWSEDEEEEEEEEVGEEEEEEEDSHIISEASETFGVDDEDSDVEDSVNGPVTPSISLPPSLGANRRSPQRRHDNRQHGFLPVTPLHNGWFSPRRRPAEGRPVESPFMTSTDDEMEVDSDN